MNPGVIILCRYDSKRLPGKILMDLGDKKILQIIHERVSVVYPVTSIVVATSDKQEDEPIVSFCKKMGYRLFRGSKNNVSKRFLDCALNENFDYAVRVNGDNLFVDIKTLSKVKSGIESQKYFFISNVKGRTFPIGMSIEAVNVEWYNKMYTEFNEEKYFEHVTLYFYEKDAYEKELFIMNEDYPKAKGEHFAIDTKEDFRIARAIYKKMNTSHLSYGLKEVCELKNEIKNE